MENVYCRSQDTTLFNIDGLSGAGFIDAVRCLFRGGTYGCAAVVNIMSAKRMQKLLLCCM